MGERMPKLRSLEIQGFRSFCRKVELSFAGDIAVLWGPNSQGKTSLCEAIEFLLTGTTVRRELTAGSQDEFAGARRNVHIGTSEDVFVQATIETDNGARHVVKRVLVRDFEKRSACDGRLEIDGKAASQADLGTLGIVLSAPPMQTPILFQHTLAYLFSAKPSDRSAYFKALLEVADLDGTRQEIQTAIRDFRAPIYALQPGLDQLKKIPSVLEVLNTHFEGKPNVARVQHGLDHAANALLQDDEHCLRGATTTAIEELRSTIDERQRSAFPMALLVFPSL